MYWLLFGAPAGRPKRQRGLLACLFPDEVSALAPRVPLTPQQIRQLGTLVAIRRITHQQFGCRAS